MTGVVALLGFVLVHGLVGADCTGVPVLNKLNKRTPTNGEDLAESSESRGELTTWSLVELAFRQSRVAPSRCAAAASIRPLCVFRAVPWAGHGDHGAMRLLRGMRIAGYRGQRMDVGAG